MINFCRGCLEKQRRIDALMEENQRLKAKLRYLERKQNQGYFGSSTPSSKVPVKTNTPKEHQRRRGGAKPGHRGHGRAGFDPSQAECITRVASEVGDRCPYCGDPLEDKGIESRSVMDIPALKAKRIRHLVTVLKTAPI